MSRRTAVCLLTADREDYTARTLKSFMVHNDDRAADLLLLHADDGSKTPANRVCAAAYGFTTVYFSTIRCGQGPALESMWQAAANAGADQILHLENDWDFVGPLPMHIRAPCVRLYGAMKGTRGPRAPAGTKILGTDEVVEWKPCAVPGWEYGTIHWGGGPSITDTRMLLQAVEGASRIKDVSLRLILPTVRPLSNIVWHFGDEPTPGHLG